jgi:hypothetical protein
MVWFSAQQMRLPAANPATVADAETTTNKIGYPGLSFDPSTIQFATFEWGLPKSWDAGTFTFIPVWEHGSASTNFGVSWGLQLVALGDNQTIDVAWGTAQFSNDVGGTAGKHYIGPECSAITAGGTPAKGAVLYGRVQRKADDATNDTLAVNAVLIGFWLVMTTDASNDA